MSHNEPQWAMIRHHPSSSVIISVQDASLSRFSGREQHRSLERQAQEATLLAYATEQLQTLEGIQLHGTAPGKAAVISFALSGVHPHDVGTFLDMDGIAIRVGHHCAQPLMDRLGVSATTRASFAFYNTKAEVDVLVDSLRRVQSFFN